MRKKGVSPVIATVLLIGIVIALSSIVFFWFRGFVQETNTKFGKNIQLNCPDVQFDAQYSNGELEMLNNGNVPIYGFSVQIDNGKGSYSTKGIEAISNWPPNGLPVGGTFSANIQSSISGAQDIILIPILRGTLSSGDQQTYTCGSQYGKKITL